MGFREDEWVSQGKKEERHFRQKKPLRHAAQRENVTGIFRELPGIQSYWGGEKQKIRSVNEEPCHVRYSKPLYEFCFSWESIAKIFLT